MIGQKDLCLEITVGKALFELVQPGADIELFGFKRRLVDVEFGLTGKGIGLYRRAVIERGGVDAEQRIVQNQSVVNSNFGQVFAVAVPDLNFRSNQTVAMNFGDFESRPGVSDAVPENAVDQAFYMTDQTRRSEKTAAWKVAKAGTHQPKKSSDMIDMGVADEHIADLMGDPGGQSSGVTQVKQQAPLMLMKPQMQQRIA